MASRPQSPLRRLHASVDALLETPADQLPAAIVALGEDLRAAEQDAANLSLVDALGSDRLEVYLLNGQTLRFADVSESAARNLGYTREELREMTPLDVISSENEQNVKQLLASMQGLASGSVVIRSQHRRRDKSSYPVEITLVLLQGTVLAIGRDLTQQPQRDQRIEQALDDLSKPNEGWIAATDAQLSIGYASEEVQRITGFSDEEILGATPALWRSGEMPQSFYRRLWARLSAGEPVRERFVNRDRDGKTFEVDQTIAPISGGPGDGDSELRYVSVGHVVQPGLAVQPGHAVEGHLRYLAYIDPLTSLPNRVLFTELLDRAVAATQARKQLCAVLLVDINRFVYINESYGSEVGDLLLKQLAMRLGRVTGDANTLARIGGDVFALVVASFEHPEELILLADKVQQEATRPFPLKGGEEARLSVSVGIATYPEDGNTTQEVVSHASVALSEARKSGRERVFFTEKLNRQAIEFLTVKDHLTRALEQHEVQAVYQPIYRLTDGALVAMEALMRFSSSPLREMSPASFIPILEELRLIVDAGAQIYDRVCADMRRWLDVGLPVVPVAVNLSALQLHEANLVTDITHTAHDHGIDPTLLTLEITESMCMQDAGRARDALCQLQTQGFSIAVDDFGTGYSSLSQLKHLPVNRLKIDMSFVQGIESQQDAGIIRAVVAMAESFNIETVAEGIENSTQLRRVRDLGCDLGQGFYLCRPLHAEDIAERLGKRFDE
ncbi:MAG: EAL domain-containing protein [Deltaproteobacteria bacterium]|nr:EAL domain-containing protein [Deltaproteobacteria bacterium]